MRRGHYGIDPRKFGVVTQSSQQTSGMQIPKAHCYSTLKRYNPYQTISHGYLHAYQQRPGSSHSLGSPATIKKAPKLSAGKIIDKIFELSRKYSLTGALEIAMTEYILCRDVYAWFDRPETGILHSQSLSKTTKYDRSILGFSYTSKEIVFCRKPLNHINHDSLIDGEDQLLYVPLKDNESNVVCVLQFRRRQDMASFSQEDIDTVAAFANKFKLYIRLLCPKNEDPLDFVSIMRVPSGKNAFFHISDKLRQYYSCKKADIFSVDGEDKYSKFVEVDGKFKPINGSIGVATSAVKYNTSLVIEHVLKNEYYNESIDGTIDESVLAQPFTIKSKNYVVVLRGPSKGTFNNADCAKLLAFSTMIDSIINNSESGGNESNTEDMAESLKALLDVAEALSGVLDIDTLIPIIMTRACELLHTERCSLFLVDHEKQELITRFQGGLDKSIRLPLSRGIVGHTATTGNIVNIDDPYSDSRFDQSVDKKTGFRTRNIVCVPIFNNRGEITGVTEMINKIDDGPFNDNDLKMLMAFNVFCGISLDNARLYQASLDLTSQLRSFISMSNALNNANGLTDIVSDILKSAKVVLHASRATVFLIQDKEMTPFVNIGDSIKHGTVFADQMESMMQATIYSPEEVNKMTDVEGSSKNTGRTKLGASRSGSTSRVSIVLGPNSSKTSFGGDVDSLLQESICTLPLISSSGKLLGVMEFSSCSKILPEDVKLVDCFAIFTAISLERSELKELATLGTFEKKIKQWMTPEERLCFDLPEKLVLDSSSYLTLNFDAASYDEMGFFKVIFQIFNHFNLLKEFKVSNEKFFRFLDEISSTYKKVPYHNWRHAVDVTQYITYELETSGIIPKLTRFELFGLLVAAICHDANHDGFSNAYNVKAETPLGILFKNQSVMETHHCAIAISVISKDETNIFSALSPEDYKKMWSLMIKLILNTDMAKHFTFLKEVNGLMDEGKLSIDNPEYKEYYLHLILKCADISNVSRPFELANRWCDVLCEEFFRQGDLEAAQGMEYTSNLNDRAHLDKPKSQIGFYTFVCLPLYKAAARAMPKLQVNADQIESNLEIWKKEAAK